MERIIAHIDECMGYYFDNPEYRNNDTPGVFGTTHNDSHLLGACAPFAHYSPLRSVFMPKTARNIITPGSGVLEDKYQRGTITIMHYPLSHRRLKKTPPFYTENPYGLVKMISAFDNPACVYFDNVCVFTLLVGEQGTTKNIMEYFKKRPEKALPALKEVLQDDFFFATRNSRARELILHDSVDKPRTSRHTIEMEAHKDIRNI